MFIDAEQHDRVCQLASAMCFSGTATLVSTEKDGTQKRLKDWMKNPADSVMWNEIQPLLTSRWLVTLILPLQPPTENVTYI